MAKNKLEGSTIFNARRRLFSGLFIKPREISRDVGKNGGDLVDAAATIKGKNTNDCVILNQRWTFIVMTRAMKIYLKSNQTYKCFELGDVWNK